jgi:hypothetical protein
MLENRVLRRKIGPEGDEVSIIKIIKSRRMRLTGHVARMGGK